MRALMSLPLMRQLLASTRVTMALSSSNSSKQPRRHHGWPNSWLWAWCCMCISWRGLDGADSKAMGFRWGCQALSF